VPLALGLVTLFAIGSVGTGSGDEPGPIGPIGLVSGAVGAAPPGNAVDRTATSAGTPILTAPDARLALPGGAPPVSELSGYRWPLPKGRLTQDYGPTTFASRVVNGQPFHDGIDLATFCGDRIVAAHDGVVLAASRHFDDVIGWVGSLDRYYKRLAAQKLWMTLPIVVVIDDENGYRSMYAHFHDVTVKPGQHVQAGDLIGHEGATGHASGCHVHYGLFSPFETNLFGVRADIIRRMKVPKHEIARIDPLLVLPGGDVALRTRSVAKAIKAAAGGS
jgi:murein DD-endopeptidase MepM/ murein hydrolase activator NlpD